MENDGWRPVEIARADGRLCKLLFDNGETFQEAAEDCFLSKDGEWYSLRPPRKITAEPLYWKPI